MKYELGIRVSVRIFLIALLAFLFFLFLFIIHDSRFIILAGHCPATDYDCQVAEIQREIDALAPAQEYNKKELEDLRVQLKDLEKRISGLSNQLEVVEADILSREEDLAYAEKIFEEKTENHYKFLRLYDPLLPFLSSDDASSAFREISLRQKAAGTSDLGDFGLSASYIFGLYSKAHWGRYLGTARIWWVVKLC